jgi:hypothetical protein
MSKTGKRAAGIGGLLGGIGYFAVFILSAIPGGEQKDSDVATFLDKGHFAAVLISAIVLFVAVAALIRLFAGLRQTITADGDSVAVDAYWGSALVACGAIVVGYVIAIAPAASLHFGGGHAIEPSVTYTFMQAGLGVVLLAGGYMFASAMIGLFIASKGALPNGIRWFSLVMGILSLTFWPLPMLALPLWAIGTGIWSLASGKEVAAARVPAPAL